MKNEEQPGCMSGFEEITKRESSITGALFW
jgi:hypothetical protein